MEDETIEVAILIMENKPNLDFIISMLKESIRDSVINELNKIKEGENGC